MSGCWPIRYRGRRHGSAHGRVGSEPTDVLLFSGAMAILALTLPWTRSSPPSRGKAPLITCCEGRSRLRSSRWQRSLPAPPRWGARGPRRGLRCAGAWREPSWRSPTRARSVPAERTGRVSFWFRSGSCFSVRRESCCGVRAGPVISAGFAVSRLPRHRPGRLLLVLPIGLAILARSSAGGCGPGGPE